MKKFISVCFVLFTVLFIFSCDDGSGNGNDDFIASSTILVGTSYTNVSIPAFGTKIYNFVAAGSGSHTISLTNLGSDCGWTLFTNPSYENPVVIQEKDTFGDSSDEIASTSILASGVTYYIAVDEWDEVSSSFDLEITYP